MFSSPPDMRSEMHASRLLAKVVRISACLATGDKTKPTPAYSGWFGDVVLTVMKVNVYYILRSIFGPSLLQTQNMNIVKSHVVYDLLMHGLLEERSDIQGGNFKVESIR